MTYTDLTSTSELAGNVRTYSVAEISHGVKTALEDAFGWVRVRGEVSSVSTPRSGHVYITFKQDRHELAAVIWKGKASRLPQPVREGVEYIATGSITAYSGTSKYQLIVDRLEPAGEGALLAMLEERKRKLQAEGMFDSSRKQDIPYLPEVIGVVSSQSGAVIRDIIRVLRDRFPRKVLLWPVAVQGPDCPAEVERAIRGFNRLDGRSGIQRPDLLIVARGGGSMEDLLGFSDESVVRAVSESSIPIISAVGHETDTPLIDLAADLRASTPSVAAEKAVPVRAELLADLVRSESRLVASANRITVRRQERLRDLSRGMPRVERLFEVPAQRLDGLSDRLPSALRVSLQANQLSLGQLSARLKVPSAMKGAEHRIAGLSARLQRRLVDERINNWRNALQSFSGRMDRGVQGAARRSSELLHRNSRMLDSLDYSNVLLRGYAIVRDKGIRGDDPG